VPRDYAREYRKETESVDFLRVRIPKETKTRFFEKAASNGITPSKWILEQIQKYLESSE